MTKSAVYLTNFKRTSKRRSGAWSAATFPLAAASPELEAELRSGLVV